MFESIDLISTSNHLYIGVRAGSPIMKKIEHAQDSITILSPYVSASYLRTLLEKQNEGVRVTLVCHQIEQLGTKSEYGLSFHDLFHQSAERDEKAHKQRHYGLLISGILIALTFTLVTVVLFLWPAWLKANSNLYTYIAAFCWMAILIISTRIFWKIKTYNYSYTPKITSLQWLGTHNSKENQDFIHAKVYVIDNKHAYIGSLNFTHYGMAKSIETRMDIHDAQVAKDLAKHIQNFTPRYAVDIQQECRKYFHEPRNGPRNRK